MRTIQNFMGTRTAALILAPVDISLLHQGIYLYKVVKGNNETFNGKLTIE